MEDKVLTPQQTKRIEEEAQEFANNRTTDSQAYKIGAQVGYVYGASAEALKGKELAVAMQEIIDELPPTTRLPITTKIQEIAKQALKNYNL